MTSAVPSPRALPLARTETQNVVVAPDSFKGSADARTIGRAIAAGWASTRPSDHITVAPMADGGEGSIDAIQCAVSDSELIPVTVMGPNGRTIRSEWLRLPDGTAVIELARCSGLTLLESPRPLDASTRGLGEAMRAAIEHGAPRLVVALGGSASTDGGSGALAALGARLRDAHGAPVAEGGRGLVNLAQVDLTTAVRPPPMGVTLLTDVRSPLLGPQGAAHVYGPQKGASAHDISVLESGLAHLATLLGVDPTVPGSGAAGGTAAGLLAWGADIAEGAPAIATLTGTATVIESAHVVITGEGRYDSQSDTGKVAAHIRTLARDASAAVGLIAGDIAAPADTFDAAISLTQLAGSAEQAIREPETWAYRAGQLMATQL